MANERMLMPHEAATILGISDDALRAMAQQGRIDYLLTVGGHHRYSETSIRQQAQAITTPDPEPQDHPGRERRVPSRPVKTPLGFGFEEQAVMDALWSAGHGEWLTAGAVQRRMSRPPTSSTVHATLSALCRKGHVQRARPTHGQNWHYRATHPRHDHLVNTILAVLAYAPDPRALLQGVLSFIESRA